MMKSILIAAIAALVSAEPSYSDTAMWRAACACIDGSNTCVLSKDVTAQSKAIFDWCNEDMPGFVGVSFPEELYDFLDTGCGGDKCKADKLPCCSGFECVYPSGRRLSNKKVYGTCIKKCGFKYDPCSKKEDCCDGFVCTNKKCLLPCVNAGGHCDGKKYNCCSGLVCTSGKCVKPCIEVGAECDIEKDHCCKGLVCTKQTSGKNKLYTCVKPCVPVGDFCEKDSDCCKGTCVGNAVGDAVIKLCTVCVGKGSPCDDNCCEPFVCDKKQVCEMKMKSGCKVTKKNDCVEQVCKHVSACVNPCVGEFQKCEKDTDCCEGFCSYKKEYGYKKCKKH